MAYSHYELPQQPATVEITTSVSDVRVLAGLACRFELKAQSVHPSEAGAEDNRHFWGEMRGLAYNLAGMIATAEVTSGQDGDRVTIVVSPEEIEPLAGFYKPETLSQP